MFDRQKYGPIVAEVVGTFILATVAIGAASYFNFTAPWYVSIAVATTLAGLVLMIGGISGAHVNPAITVGLWSLRKIQTSAALVYIAAQMLGGILAVTFVEYVVGFGSDIVTSGAVDRPVFVSEMVGAAIFAMGVAAAVLNKLEGLTRAFAIGSSLMAGVLVASISGPGFINPAIAVSNYLFNPTVVAAPIVGGLIGMNLYSAMFAAVPKKASSRKKK